MGRRITRRTYAHTCLFCGHGEAETDWESYICPAPGCGRLNSRLYRREHVDIVRGMTMTEEDIVAEYQVNGIPMTPIHVSDLDYYRRETA